MKSKKKIFMVSVSVIVLIVLCVFVYLRIRSNILASEKKSASALSVEITKPVRGDISSIINFSGDILAIEQTSIFSRVNGNIEKIFVDIGDYVGSGKLLAVIDKSLYTQNVKQIEGVYRVAEATAENDKINLERTKILFEKGLASQSDYDNAKTKLDVSIAQMETAYANLQNSRIQLSYCDIRAPFSGYITKKLLDRGTYVSSTGASQNTIFVLSDIRKLKIMVNVLERDLPLLDKVSNANIKIDAYPDRTFTGRFNKISQSIDLSTRTMPAQIDIENKDELLKPGMFAKVELMLDKNTDIIKLPSQCVLQEGEKNYIFVVNDEMVANKMYVETGIIANNETEIVKGLGENDKVVIVGQELISDKSKVKIVK
ncbi:MAG: efflux RND transporter periplasmic adaptor subunit [Ignavibacteriota bacterium]